MPTIKQEHAPSYTAAQMEQVRAELQVAVSQRNDLLEQRDDLLAACEALQAAAVLLHNHAIAGTDYSEKTVLEAFSFARAAIAKARG